MELKTTTLLLAALLLLLPVASAQHTTTSNHCPTPECPLWARAPNYSTPISTSTHQRSHLQTTIPRAQTHYVFEEIIHPPRTMYVHYNQNYYNHYSSTYKTHTTRHYAHNQPHLHRNHQPTILQGRNFNRYY
ncbi:MAG: hypothetical protein ACMXYD_00385 [Candidatus Woesearchaeota archaeon]